VPPSQGGLTGGLVCRRGVRSSTSSRSTRRCDGYCIGMGRGSRSSNSVCSVSKPVVIAMVDSLRYSVAKNVNPIGTGMTVHALLHSEEEAAAAVEVEVSLGMRMTGGHTGTGIGIVRDVMKMTMALDEVAPACPITIGLTVAGTAVTAVHLKIIMHYPPSNSIPSLLRPHP